MVERKMESRLVCLALIFGGLFIFLKSDKTKQYIWSDSEGYYMYLPAITMYGFENIPIRTTAQFSKVESTGRFYDKYTAGVAIMQAPFFTIASVYCLLSNKYKSDGYSLPYELAILIASIFYAFAGIFLLFKTLRKEYSLLISIFTLFAIYLGTNLFYYSTREPGASHVYAFFLWALLIYFTPRIYKNPTWTNFILLSLIIGLQVYIRPSNAIGAIYILLYDLTSLKERVNYVYKNFIKYCILIAPFMLLSLFQILLWKHMSGELILFSYNQEPGFIYFHAPKITNVLFHVHNGLFIYSPILLLSVFGLIIGIEKYKNNFILYSLLLTIATYIFGSWWAWWFGGAYGHRCYVDLLPLLAIPLAYTYQQVLLSRFLTFKIAILLCSLISIYYSINMTSAYRSPWDGPNFGWQEFWKIVSTHVF